MDNRKEIVKPKGYITSRKPNQYQNFVTEDMKKGMVTAVANGLTPHEAAMAVGLNKKWMDMERESNPEFDVEILKALQSFKLYHLNNISKHGKHSWQASAWLLERSFPERFNSRVAQEMAAKAKPKAPPKWFGQDFEDVEYEDEPSRDTTSDQDTPPQETENDQAT